MTRGGLYLGMAIAGFVIPWFFLFDFILSGTATPSLFFSSLFANAVASAVSADLLLSALVFWLFVSHEGRRVGMRWLWVYPIAAFAVGLSFALPLFLYSRHLALEVKHG